MIGSSEHSGLISKFQDSLNYTARSCLTKISDTGVYSCNLSTGRWRQGDDQAAKTSLSYTRYVSQKDKKTPPPRLHAIDSWWSLSSKARSWQGPVTRQECWTERALVKGTLVGGLSCALSTMWGHALGRHLSACCPPTLWFIPYFKVVAKTLLMKNPSSHPAGHKREFTVEPF